jgi:MerR family transcriptional regulator, light-induced transcriptional regulator
MVRHTVYTIKQASARTGLGAPLIRAWERRYGVVAPTRTPAGYRMYDEAAIKVLLAMRGLLDRGWTASEAARAITAGEVAVGEVAIEPPAGSEPGMSSAAAQRTRVIDRFVAAAESTSPPEIEAAIDEILASGSFEAVVDDLLLPAAAAIGESWAAGRLGVAAEHAASAAIARRLAAAYQAAAVAGRTTVLVGLPPGSRHELGALAFAVALRRRGVGVMYLGADVPVDAWVDIAQRTRARAAVIGVVTEADRGPAAAVVDALRAGSVGIVAVGGAAATGGSSLADGVLELPERVVDASAAIAHAIGRRS